MDLSGCSLEKLREDGEFTLFRGRAAEASEEEELLVTVRDHGIGLDPSGIDQVFAAFHTTKPGGLGMGLSISRSIIESHAGRLWASGNDGPGASFQFTLSTHPGGQAQD
jgi:signal transduction histidine kinase